VSGRRPSNGRPVARGHRRPAPRRGGNAEKYAVESVRGRLPDRQQQRGRPADRQHQRDADARHRARGGRRTAFATQAGLQYRQADHGERQHGRPDQVELFLHRQRPEVLQRRDGRLAEVVGAVPAELHVGGEDARPEAVGEHRLGAHRVEDEQRRNPGRQDDNRRGRQNAQGATGIELREAHHSIGGVGEQRAGDEETGDHEQDVDPTKRPATPGKFAWFSTTSAAAPCLDRTPCRGPAARVDRAACGVAARRGCSAGA